MEITRYRCMQPPRLIDASRFRHLSTLRFFTIRSRNPFGDAFSEIRIKPPLSGMGQLASGISLLCRSAMRGWWWLNKGGSVCVRARTSRMRAKRTLAFGYVLVISRDKTQRVSQSTDRCNSTMHARCRALAMNQTRQSS